MKARSWGGRVLGTGTASGGSAWQECKHHTASLLDSCCSNRIRGASKRPPQGAGKGAADGNTKSVLLVKRRLLLRFPMIGKRADRHNENHRWTEERHVQVLFCWLAASWTQSRLVVFATFTAFQHDRKDSRAILSLFPSRRLALYVLGFRIRFIQETLAPDSRSAQVGSRNHGCSCCPWRAVVACSAPLAVKRAVDRYRIWADAHSTRRASHLSPHRHRLYCHRRRLPSCFLFSMLARLFWKWPEYPYIAGFH